MNNQELPEISKRVKEVMEYSKLTPVYFAEKIGVRAPLVHNVLVGRIEPSVRMLQNILLTFPEISVEYLVLGKGKLIEQGVSVNSDIDEIREVVKKHYYIADNLLLKLYGK